jgi:hypothetical protein
VATPSCTDQSRSRTTAARAAARTRHAIRTPTDDGADAARRDEGGRERRAERERPDEDRVGARDARGQAHERGPGALAGRPAQPDRVDDGEQRHDGQRPVPGAGEDVDHGGAEDEEVAAHARSQRAVADGVGEQRHRRERDGDVQQLRAEDDPRRGDRQSADGDGAPPPTPSRRASSRPAPPPRVREREDDVDRAQRVVALGDRRFGTTCRSDTRRSGRG